MRMTLNNMKKTASAGLLSAITLALSAGTSLADTTLTFFTGNDPAVVAISEALAKSFEEKNPDVTVEIEIGPGGTERDNLVKSRLATGTMSDVFLYNSGSLFQALNPTRTMVDLSNEPWMDQISESFRQVVTASDGTIRGAPVQTAMGGGMFYNKKVYEQLGLSVPKTWDEFMANNEKIKEAGIVPVVQTYRDTWTSQIMVLGDYYNVQADNPDFAQQYTQNKAKFATTEEATNSFRHLAQVHDAGYLNEDFGAATLNDGLRMVATGEGAHYPMLSFAIGVIGQTYPDNLNDVGIFGIPGDDPEKNGLTVWLPNGIYISQETPNLEVAKEFVKFAASVEGCKVQMEASVVTGPFLVKGCDLPEDVPAAVKDMNAYFQKDGATSPALEFLSPVKGPSLENLTVEVGSGIRPAEEAAKLYDEDVKKQALQLGLDGWD